MVEAAKECWVFPASFSEQQEGIRIEASSADEALLKAQDIASDRHEEVDIWLPPEWDPKCAVARLGDRINGTVVADLSTAGRIPLASKQAIASGGATNG